MKLTDYNMLIEKESAYLDNLIIGNGFSRNFDKFDYDHLYDVAKNKLSDRQRYFFEEFTKNNNFEEVLHALNVTIKTNKAYEIENQPIINDYKTIKKVLIDCVREVHSHFDEMSSEMKLILIKLFVAAQKYIFTTNYDLYTYWGQIKATTLKDNSGKKLALISDSFRNRPLGFPHFNTNLKGYESSKKVYFLHGGLHLYESEKYIRKVIKKDASTLLQAIEASISDDNVPLYIAEGDSKYKLDAIKENKYLAYCYESLKNMDGCLSIFGHNLNASDQHIIDAINNSNIKKIAFGIYSEDGKVDTIMRLREVVDKRINIDFFHSKTFLDYLYNYQFLNISNEEILEKLDRDRKDYH